jgi:DNA-binding LacI/PurR family transcriptional regulator
VVRDILASSNRPDGIVASSDFSAKSIFDVCVELGLDIPGDLAVVGFFNTPWADFVSPQISSISIREDLMASTLTSELISTYSTKGKVSKEIIIPPELIIRESSVKRNDKNAEKLAAIHKGKILTKKLA